MADTVTLPREPTTAMIKAAIEAGVGASRHEKGKRPALGDVIRAEYAAMIRVAEEAAEYRRDAENNGPDRY